MQSILNQKILWILFLAFFLPLNAKADPINSRIFGGGVSKASKSIALLIEGQKGFRGIYLCSGTFITKTKFLTAKHCVGKNGFKSPSFSILTSPRGTPIKVKRIQKSSTLDLAILSVASSNVNPLPIMLSREVVVGDQVQFYGYGQDQNQKTAVERSPKVFLKFGSGSIGDIDQSFYYFINTAAGGACHGDSGGPIAALNSEGQAGVIGVANAILSTTNSNKCAAGVLARYTKITEQAAINFIAAFAPEASVN